MDVSHGPTVVHCRYVTQAETLQYLNCGKSPTKQINSCDKSLLNQIPTDISLGPLS